VSFLFTGKYIIREFQFLRGAIGSVQFQRLPIWAKQFQFLRGAIGSIFSEQTYLDNSVKFQFLRGAIGSALPIDENEHPLLVSIP